MLLLLLLYGEKCFLKNFPKSGFVLPYILAVMSVKYLGVRHLPNEKSIHTLHCVWLPANLTGVKADGHFNLQFSELLCVSGPGARSQLLSKFRNMAF